MKHFFITSIIALVVATTFSSCTSVSHPDPYVRQGRRTGAAVGAATGAIIGNNVSGGSSWGGAAIGAAVGGLAGDRRGKVNSMYYGGPRGYYGSPYRYRYY